MLKSVGMSVEPWMFAWPRSARIPPPGRPMFPRRSCTIAAARMYWTPTVCWVQPRRIAALELDAVSAMGLLARDVRDLLALAGGGLLLLGLRVAPARDPV